MNRLSFVLVAALFACACGNSFQANWERGLELQKAGNTLEAMEAYATAGHAALDRNKKGYALKAYARVESIYTKQGFKPGSPAAEVAAEAAFRTAEFDYREAQAVTLDGTTKEQKKAVEKKRDLLLKAEARYSKVPGYESPHWMVAAAYKVGKLWVNLGQTLRKSSLPEDLPKEEGVEDVYRDEMEKYAVMFEDKGIGIWQKGEQIASELSVENEWVEMTRKALEKYAR
jgi:hypothetical protein